jgi:hypothetical protein
VKNKKTFIYSLIVILILCSCFVSATNYNNFEKIVSGLTQFPVNTNYLIPTSSYFNFGGNLYNPDTYSFIKSNSNFTNGYMDNTYFYKIGVLTLSKYLISDGSRVGYNSNISLGNNLGTNFDKTGYYHEEGSYLIGLSGDSVNKNGYYTIYRKEDNSTVCFYALLPGGMVNTEYLLGMDSDYVYIFSYGNSGTYGYYTVMDYNCNRVLYTPTFASNLGLNNASVDSGLSNVFYDENTQIFVSLFYNTTKKQIITFDTSGMLIDTENIPLSNIALTNKKNICAFDYINKEYSCIFYNGASSYTNISILKYNISQFGIISSSEYYNVTELMGIPNTDVYTYQTNSPQIFYKNGYLYTELYDSVSQNYDLFKSVEVNNIICSGLNTTGLSCFVNSSNQCECYSNTAYCQQGGNTGYFCNNPYYYQYTDIYTNLVTVEGECDINDAVFCTNGCNNTIGTNIYGVKYTYGVCSNSTTCMSTCTINGYAQCTNSNTYAVCGHYPSDNVCLTLGAFTGCGTGYICQDGGCIFRNTTPTTINNPTFSVIPVTTPTCIVVNGNQLCNTFTADYTKNTLNVLKVFGGAVATPSFTISTNSNPFYIALNCNYLETKIYSNNTINTNASSTTDTFNNFQSGYTITNLLPYDYSTLLIEGLDASNKYHYRYFLVRDYNTNICLYKANSTNNMSNTYWCDSTITGDIQNIELSIASIPQSGGEIIYSSQTIITKSDGSKVKHITNEERTEDITVTNLYKQRMTSNSSFNYKGLNVYNGQDYNLNWVNIAGQKPSCVQGNATCQTYRFYGSDSVYHNLFNYQDWKVCVNAQIGGIGAVTGGGTNNSPFGIRLSDLAKLLLGIGIPLIVFAGCSVLGFMGGMPQIGLLLGSIFGIGALIGMVAVGWLEVWILIVMAMVTGVGAVLMYRIFMNGGSS